MCDEVNSDAEVESSDKNVKMSEKKNKRTIPETSGIAKDTVGELQEIVDRLKAALFQTGKARNVKSKHVVKRVSKFHAVMTICMEQFLPKLMGMLHVPESKYPNNVVLPSPKNRTWKSVRGVVKSYLAALIQSISEPVVKKMKEDVLKHIHDIICFYTFFPDLSRMVIKILIEFWSFEEERVRDVALCCITRVVQHFPDDLVEICFQQIYWAYCSSCEFTTVQSLPLNSYKKTSLVKLMVLRPFWGYRTMLQKLNFENAEGIIEERKGMNEYRVERTGNEPKKPKLGYPSNCSLMRLHSLALWTEFICRLKSEDSIQDTICRLFMCFDATIRANPSVQYYLLRFFCVRLMIQLCEAYDEKTLFAPVLEHLTMILLHCSLLLSNPEQSSMQMCNFEVIRKMSESEVCEKAFLDGVIEQIFELVLQFCNSLSEWPGLVIMLLRPIAEITEFLRRCRAESYRKKMKELLQKLQEMSKNLEKPLCRRSRTGKTDMSQVSM